MRTPTHIERTRTRSLSLPLTLLVGLVAALLLVFAAAAQAAVVNEIEPNDSIQTAQNLEGSSFDTTANTDIGRLIPGATPSTSAWVDTSESIPHATVNATNDGTDYYSFTVPEAADTTDYVGMFDIDYGVGTDNPVFSHHPAITLYDTSGNQLAFNDDTDPVDPGSTRAYGGETWSFDSYLQYAFPGSGTYVVMVDGGNSYQLHVSVGQMGTDNTPPQLYLSDMTVEATSANGATVSFYPKPTALDDWYGTVSVTCTPASGSTFPLGTTTVNCSAEDGAGNVGTGSFNVTVVDTMPPDITLPPEADVDHTIFVEPTSSQGARVTWTEATATDLVDGNVAVTSDYASGSRFPVGTTVVTFTATDSHGNTGSSYMYVSVHDTYAPTAKVLADGAPRVATTANVRATFSEPVSGVDNNTFYLRKVISTGKKTPPTYEPVDASVTPSEDGKTAVLDPTNDLTKGGTYEARLTSDVTDYGYNPLVVPKPYTFTVTK